MKPQLICGVFCKNCNMHKTHKITEKLTEPALNDDESDLIKGYDAGEEEPKLFTTSLMSRRSIDGIKNAFNMCEDDNHVVKKSQFMSAFRRHVTRPIKIKIHHLLMIIMIITLILLLQKKHKNRKLIYKRKRNII